MKYTTTVLCLFLSFVLSAQDGYEIKLTLKPYRNQWVYLGHYFGKRLPIVDSVMLNDKSEGVFKGAKTLGGGIYLIGFPIKIEEKRAKTVKELQTVPCRRHFPRVVSGILNWHPPTPCVKLSVIFTP